MERIISYIIWALRFQNLFFVQKLDNKYINKINKYYLSKYLLRMSQNNLSKAQQAMNQFVTSQQNINQTVGTGIPNTTGYVSSGSQVGSTNPFVNATARLASAGAPIAGQNFLSPNTAQTYVTQSRPSPVYANQYQNIQYTNQDNIQRLIGTATQPTQTRIIENQVPAQRIISKQISPVKYSGAQFNGSSKVQYYPYQKKVVDIQEKQIRQRVPRTRKVVEIAEQAVTQVIPREVTKTEYYAVQYLKQYVPKYVPQKITNMVRKAVPYKRVEYVPVTRQVYHGAPFGNEGIQNTPFCGGITGQLNQAGGVRQWQNNVNMAQIYGRPGMYGYGGLYGGYGLLSTSCCDQFKRKFNNIYDSYQSYVPSFKY